MPKVIVNSNTSFDANAQETILDAALRQGVYFPYSCRSGRCLACRCRVTAGEAKSLNDHSELSDTEISDGWVLACTHSAQSELEVEVEDVGQFPMPPIKTLPCRISEIIRLTTDIVKVLIRLQPTAKLSYFPGQYIEMIGPNGIRRSYSLANADGMMNVLELHIRAVKDGVMSDYWFNQAKPNDLLRLSGPMGTFFLRGTVGLDLFFLATGTGIAPVKAMLDSLSRIQDDDLPKSITVLWGARKVEDFYLDFKDIPSCHAYIPVLSRPVDEWEGATGHIQDVMLDTNPVLTNAAVYACGSDAMIRSARACLIEAGLPAKRFYSDAFVSSGADQSN